ncbi:hypothetical protein Gohar_004885 [Gossypium harknessii]|uniref:CCHC-type domain-containing protein n=1 Tax=Gossypium harknessii TaxID=34285 RepID=A0A7J9H8V2_9ROSI|nr:hypothetical protein [Gossypium harknessii]
MMDIKNGYFLVKFQNKLDCERALAEGPCIIFCQYLTVQPWTLAFDPTQPYPSVVMAWIRFPGLPGYLYNPKIIIEIGEMPLVSYILIKGRKQNVEYKSLSTICFHCERYGHVKNSCPFKNSEIPSAKENAPSKMSSEIQNTVKVVWRRNTGISDHR